MLQCCVSHLDLLWWKMHRCPCYYARAALYVSRVWGGFLSPAAVLRSVWPSWFSNWAGLDTLHIQAVSQALLAARLLTLSVPIPASILSAQLSHLKRQVRRFSPSRRKIINSVEKRETDVERKQAVWLACNNLASRRFKMTRWRLNQIIRSAPLAFFFCLLFVWCRNWWNEMNLRDELTRWMLMLFAFYRTNCCDVEPRANKNFSPVLSLSRCYSLADTWWRTNRGNVFHSARTAGVLLLLRCRLLPHGYKRQPKNLNNRAVSV